MFLGSSNHQDGGLMNNDYNLKDFLKVVTNYVWSFEKEMANNQHLEFMWMRD